MSRARLALAIAITGLAVVGSTWTIASAVPLRTERRYLPRESTRPPVAASSSSFARIVLPQASLNAPPPPPPPPAFDLSVPRVMRQRKPDYPPEALPYGVEATTTVKVTIATSGEVVKAQTVKWRLAFDHEIDDPNYWASHPEQPFAAAGEAAAGQWRFAPLPAETTCEISFTFRTRKDGDPMFTTPPASTGVKFLEGGTPGVKAIHVGGAVKAPERTVYVAPLLPRAASDARVEGTVVVEARIGTDGAVVDARAVLSIPMLDEPALAAVRQWRYTPTLLNGEPVEVLLTVPVTFPSHR